MSYADKYSLDRMQDKKIEPNFYCPYCKGSRIEMKDADELDSWKGFHAQILNPF